MVVLVVGSNCVIPETGGSGGGGGGGRGGGGGAQGGGGGGGTMATLGCPEILSCAADCADNDDPCYEACVAAGTPSGLTLVRALTDCNTAFSCNDAACLRLNCAQQLDACNGVSGGGAGGGGGGGGDVESSTFEGGVDGWQVAGDAQTSSVTPDYNGTGGNPGGLISADDDVAGGTWYFVAPAKYLGDQRAVLGLNLRYDVKVTPISSPFGNYDVVLIGGGLVIAYNTTPDPSTTWTRYVVPLSAPGWKTVPSAIKSEINDAAFAALPTTTPQEFETVLSSLTTLRIRGEFNNGSDTGSLDNVRWGSP